MNVPQKLRLSANAMTCPHCQSQSYFDIENIWPELPDKRLGNDGLSRALYEKLNKRFYSRVSTCVGCKQPVIDIFPNGIGAPGGGSKRIWPTQSRRFPFPEYVDKIPRSIVSDFTEASLIEDLSPSASATLSRRCLQTILKDQFQNVLGDAYNLKKQVEKVLLANVLPSHIDDELHGIRSIGNNAAHPNIDPATNEIIEVQSGEAAACLDVLEDLIDHCYVRPIKATLRKEAREKKFGRDDT